MTIEQLESKKLGMYATAKELASNGGDLSEVKSLMSEAKQIDERIDAIKSLGETAPVAKPVAQPWENGGVTKSAFVGTRAEQNYKGYVMGQFALAVTGNKRSEAWLKSNGHLKAQVEGTTTLGGFLVPDLLSSDLVYLREMYGAARQNCRIVPMTSDVQLVPNATASTTVYYPGENAAITASDMTFAQISLTAKKMAILTVVSKELNEDSVVDVGNALARDFAYNLAREEDRVVFNSALSGSDASGLVGMGRTLLDLASLTPANYGNIAGAVVGAAGTGASWAGFTLANIQAMVGKLPTYADNPKWYMHKNMFYQGIADKLAALGGNNISAIENAYGVQPILFGLPVVFVQNMPSAPAINTPTAFLADLSKGVAFGDRRGITIEMSDQRYFVEDSWAFKATERFSVNCFDAGNYNTAAASRVVGSFVGLITGQS
jgi:HK97 family phage major capsid protein